MIDFLGLTWQKGKLLNFYHYCFVHFLCLVFGHFCRQNTKIQKYYVIFVYILPGKMGKAEKKQKENHATKITKIPKTKRQKYGMNETLVTKAEAISSFSAHQLSSFLWVWPIKMQNCQAFWLVENTQKLESWKTWER